MRDERILGLIFLTHLITISLLGCSNNQVENSQIQTNNSPALTIEKVDFKSFTYNYPNGENKTFTLSNGEQPYGGTVDISFKLFEVNYADLTNDENNEAIVSIKVGLAVSGRNLVYIYSVENNELKTLWSFWTGELAFGGLKMAYSENGNLVIETFGKNKFENDKWTFQNLVNNYETLPPTAYTKIAFKWNGEKFIPFGERQVFDYKK